MPAIAASVAFQITLAGGIGSIITGALTSLASSLILSGLQKLIAPKPPKPRGGSSAIQNSGITQQVKQAIMVRKPVYGEMRRSGGLLFLAVSNNNKYLHMIVEVAPHEVDEIGEVWLNDYSVAPDHLDGDGNVTTGRYDGLVRIRKHLGTASQTADTFLTADVPEWTVNHRLRGIAYIYVRLKWDQDKFPTGIPNISAWVKGKKVYDPRTTLTTYSNNPALMVNDYLLDVSFGLGEDTAFIDSTYTTAAANECDETVSTTAYAVAATSVSDTTDIITLAGDRLFFQRGDTVQATTTGTLPTGISAATDYYVIPYQRKDTTRIKLASSYANALAGTAINLTSAGSGTLTLTKTAEPRYSGAFVIDSEQEIGENIKDIISGMIGTLTYSTGVYKMLAGSYQVPSVYFDESNIVSSVSLQTKLSKRERFNTVRGVYVSPINDGEPSDYPQISNSTYVTQDGEVIVKQLDMPVIQRPHTAQRIAKIALELSRQELTWSADFDMSALQVIAGDNAYFTFDKFGWSNKVFQIQDWNFDIREDENISRPVIRMTMREIASANYDWNSGEETSVDPAPNTVLPDPFTVAAVTGLAVSSEQVATQQADSIFKILLQWNVSDNEFVANGGFYEIQYKLSSEATFRPTYVVSGGFNFAEVTVAAQLNTEYDIRVRAVNNLGVRSAYTTILNYLVGTSGGVGSTEDWGEWVSSPSSSEDWGDYVSSPATSDDWGYFT
jgi:hypothetical protein